MNESWSERIAKEKAEQEAALARDPCVVCEKPYVAGESFSIRSRDRRWAHGECARTRRSREPRPCMICGWIRPVLVRTDPLYGKEWFSRLCQACDLDSSATIYERRAAQKRAKARAIRGKRSSDGSV